MSTEAVRLIIRSIREGKLDEHLHRLDQEIWERVRIQDEKPREDIREGDYVEFMGEIAPRYLLGLPGKVVKVNPKSVKVRLPDEAQYGRFAGARGLRVPKDLVRIKKVLL